MSNSSYFREQAARFDRVADGCSVPDLVPYYRRLAAEYRRRAANGSSEAPPPGEPEAIEFPEEPGAATLEAGVLPNIIEDE